MGPPAWESQHHPCSPPRPRLATAGLEVPKHTSRPAGAGGSQCRPQDPQRACGSPGGQQGPKPSLSPGLPTGASRSPALAAAALDRTQPGGRLLSSYTCPHFSRPPLTHSQTTGEPSPSRGYPQLPATSETFHRRAERVQARREKAGTAVAQTPTLCHSSQPRVLGMGGDAGSYERDATLSAQGPRTPTQRVFTRKSYSVLHFPERLRNTLDTTTAGTGDRGPCH